MKDTTGEVRRVVIIVHGYAEHSERYAHVAAALTAGGTAVYHAGDTDFIPEMKDLNVDIALLPVGAIEQHGPHLPLDTDAFDADYLARRVAMACSSPVPVVLPLIPYGVSYHHEGFKGTISISNDVLSRLVYEVGLSAAHNGIKKLVIINGHGGNGPGDLHRGARFEVVHGERDVVSRSTTAVPSPSSSMLYCPKAAPFSLRSIAASGAPVGGGWPKPRR